MRGWRLLLFSFVILAVLIAAAWSFLTYGMPEQMLWLAVLIMVVILAAIVLFSYLVVKPMTLGYAKQRARDYCESGEIKDPEIYERVCHKLYSAKDDPEAVRLNEQLHDLKNKGKELK